MNPAIHAQSFWPDFTCPSCGHGLYAYWDTEYGDPIDGEHHRTCPECSAAITLTVATTTTYTATHLPLTEETT